MTDKSFKSILYAVCIMTVTLGLLASTALESQAAPKKVCLMGQCWRQIDVNKLGDIGCPAPMLIINNVLRELNGYLAYRDKLRLSDDQLKKLRLIKYRCHNTLIKKRAELNLFSIDLLDNMSSNQFEIEKVLELTGKLKATCHSLLCGVIKEAIAARNVLTPEQRQKAKELSF